MKVFPTIERAFKLLDDQEETLSRFNRRTQKSKSLSSNQTDKSFRGTIIGKEFKVISSVIGHGSFCIMSGKIDSKKGYVIVEIHKVFKILAGILLCLPFVGFIALTITDVEEFSPIFILVAIAQVLMIRYFFIEIAFRLLSKLSLNKLRDVLDIEWLEN